VLFVADKQRELTATEQRSEVSIEADEVFATLCNCAFQRSWTLIAA